MNHRRTRLVVLLCSLVAAASNGPAQTNFWVDPGGGFSGDYSDGTHWSGGVPGSTDPVSFTNGQGSAYTVSFTGSAINGPLTVGSMTNPYYADAFDKVIFDLNGFSWTNGSLLLVGGDDVTFTSTSGGQGTVVFNGTSYMYNYSPYSQMTITNTKVVFNAPLSIHQMNAKLQGTGAELVVPVSAGDFGGVWDVADGARLSAYVMSLGGYAYAGTGGVMTVRNSSTLDASVNSFYVGYGDTYVVNILSNSSFLAGGTMYVGSLYFVGTGLYTGDLLVDNSTLVANNLQIGAVPLGYTGAGRVTIQNGSTATISNSVLVSGGTRLGATDALVLNNATINLGRPGVNGAITNAGILRASGTITGMGSGPGLVRIESFGNSSNGLFVVGNSIGQLTLNNINLEVAAGTMTEWEFSETDLDRIILNGGSASLLGSNVYSLVGPAPTPGVKWGLGTYDFIVGSNVTWNPQYDDLVSVLAGYGLVQNLDYRFGVVDLGGGLQALQLEFVPEPSTVLLLVGGGLLLWRFRRRR